MFMQVAIDTNNEIYEDITIDELYNNFYMYLDEYNRVVIRTKKEPWVVNLNHNKLSIKFKEIKQYAIECTKNFIFVFAWYEGGIITIKQAKRGELKNILNMLDDSPFDLIEYYDIKE